MNATIFPEKKKHYPVLLDEIISIITPQYGGTFIDCTLGQGGYSKKILEYDKSKVIAPCHTMEQGHRKKGEFKWKQQK